MANEPETVRYTRTLFVLVQDDGRLWCAACARENFGIAFPSFTTPIYEEDMEGVHVAGICATCRKMFPADRCGQTLPVSPDMPCMRAKAHAGEHCPMPLCLRHSDHAAAAAEVTS